MEVEKSLALRYLSVSGLWEAGREHSRDVQGIQATYVLTEVAPGSKSMPSAGSHPFAWFPSPQALSLPSRPLSVVSLAVFLCPGPAALRRCLCRGADARPPDHEGEYASASHPRDDHQRPPGTSGSREGPITHPPAATFQHQPPAPLLGDCMSLLTAQHFSVWHAAPKCCTHCPPVCPAAGTDPSVRPGKGRW